MWRLQTTPKGFFLWKNRHNQTIIHKTRPLLTSYDKHFFIGSFALLSNYRGFVLMRSIHNVVSYGASCAAYPATFGTTPKWIIEYLNHEKKVFLDNKDSIFLQKSIVHVQKWGGYTTITDPWNSKIKGHTDS